jgi:hypothetical protein
LFVVSSETVSAEREDGDMNDKTNLDVWQLPRDVAWHGCLPDLEDRELSGPLSSREAVLRWAELRKRPETTLVVNDL